MNSLGNIVPRIFCPSYWFGLVFDFLVLNSCINVLCDLVLIFGVLNTNSNSCACVRIYQTFSLSFSNFDCVCSKQQQHKNSLIVCHSRSKCETLVHQIERYTIIKGFVGCPFNAKLIILI